MRISWVGLQLLLSCTLLLGPAALGAKGKCKHGELSAEEGGCKNKHPHLEDESDESEESKKSEESDESEESKKSKKSVKSEESEESKTSEKSEEPDELDESEESEELDGPDESDKATGDFTKYLKRRARKQQERMADYAAQGLEAVPHYFKEQAIAYHNHVNPGPFYQHLEDSQLEIKKAIGVMVYIKLVLAKTNCSKSKEQGGDVEYSRAYLEENSCQVLPGPEQEKHHCTFGIFIDTRTEKKVVVSNYCFTAPRPEEPTKDSEDH